MSAYQYTNVPGAEILHGLASEIGTGKNYLTEQRSALDISRKMGLQNQKRFTLQLDDQRQLGYQTLLMAPNAVTSLGPFSYQAPRSGAQRERVLLQQELSKTPVNSTVAADILTEPAKKEEEETKEEKATYEEDLRNQFMEENQMVHPYNLR